MKRFDFPLDRVRRWRLEQLNLEQIRLQQALGERQALAGAKRLVLDELSASEQDVLAQSPLRGEELENLDSYRLHVQARIRDFAARERQSEAKIMEQRARVVDARQRYELLDRLREKAFAKWRAASDKEQETLAAEMFLAKSIRESSRPRMNANQRE